MSSDLDRTTSRVPDASADRQLRWLPAKFKKADLSELLELGAEWIWETDAEHRFSMFSDNMFAVTGLDPQDLLGRSRTELFATLAKFNAAVEDHLADLENQRPFRDFIYEFMSGHEEFRWCCVSGIPRYDDLGGFIGYRGIGRNVTGLFDTHAQVDGMRKRLEKSRVLLESVFEAVDIGMLVLDQDDRLVMANTHMREFFPTLAPHVVEGAGLRDILAVGYDSGQLTATPGEGTEAEETDREIWLDRRVGEYHVPSFEREQKIDDGRWLQLRNRRLENGMMVGVRTDITGIKEREERLEKLLAQNSLAVEVINGVDQAIFVKDEDLRIVAANKPFEEIVGTTFEDMEGGTAYDLVSEEEAAFFEESERRVLETGEPYYTVESHKDDNGETCWRVIRKHRIETSDGKVYVAIFVNDVTELKASEVEAQEAKAEAEAAHARMQGAIDALHAGFAIWDKDDQFVVCNDDFRRQFANSVDLTVGQSYEESVGKLAATGIIADAVGREEDWVREHLAVRESELGQEIIFKTHDDRWIMRRDQLTKAGDRVCIRMDVTKVKQREEEAREARERLANVLEFMPAGIVIYDKDDRFVLSNSLIRGANPELDPAMRPGRPLREAMEIAHDNGLFRQSDDAELDALYETDREAWIAGYIERYHRTYHTSERLTPDGRWFRVIDTRTEDGTYIGVRIDITDQKTRECQLDDAKIKAELADRAKSEFLANMSHEIRTPMNGVLGMAELLARTDLDAKQRTFADIIFKSGNALLTIINDILDFSKIDAGQLTLDPVPFALGEAIEDVAALVAVRAREKDLELIVRVDPALPSHFVGDVGRIRQIVTNLMGNALKFTERGHVFVDVTGNSMDDATRLTLSVTDTGIGIPEEKLPAVFDKFSQVDGSSTRRHEGTGLGLAITLRLVELMGGTITAQSVEGEGSTFAVELELPHHHEETRKPVMPAQVTGARVLIIDDNEVNRTILMEQMASWSFDACAASDGVEGLAILRAAAGLGVPVDCVVLDYHMPEMNGEEVARAIRDDADIAGTPIVLLTSVDLTMTSAQYAALGVDSYLVKPARSSALLEVITACVQKSRGGGHSEILSAPPSQAQADTDKPEKTGAPDAAPEFSDADPQEASAHRLDILVAEDNEVNQLVLTQILSETPYTFEIVVNGELAVEAWHDMRPRLVLMDVSMPHMNGLEATAHIRRAEQRSDLPRTPIVGVTAHALKGDRERCLESGMDDYLSKPISPDALQKKCREWLEQASAKRSAG